MKTLLASLLLTVSVPLLAEEQTKLAALKAADEARVAAMQSGNREQLGRIFSDELHYAHSTGVVDSKTSFIDILSARKTKYPSYDYEERNFTFPAPGIALMTGRVRMKVEADGTLIDNVLSFLAVWREEKGQWRFLAWQSCKLPPVAK